MKEGKRRVKSEGVRGTYVRQACNHCRRRKSKCDGQEPVCGPCRESGRAEECSWGKDTAKKARTQQHYEALQNRIKTLEQRVRELEAQLSGTTLQSSTNDSTLPEPGPSSSQINNPQPPSSSYAKTEPDEYAPDPIQSPPSSNGGDSDIEQLIAPTRGLVLRAESEMQFYGPTSAFRMAPEQKSPCDCPNDDCEHRVDSTVAVSPHIDFARYLPQEAPLSRDEHDKLLDLFFKFFSGWCMRVVPELFIRDMRRALTLPPASKPPKSSHYSPMLHNSIFSVAAAFSDDFYIRDNKFRDLFAQKAKSYMEQDCEKPNICLVMGLSLLASYHATKGEQSLGYLYFGMSGRISQALGLAIDCTPWVRTGLIREADATDRNWAYWATYTQDVCWSLYCGRDRCFISHKESEQIPIPFVNTDIDKASFILPNSKFPVQSSNIASIFAASCSLLHIAERVAEFVNGLGYDFRNTNMQIVSELDIELNAWKDQLSPELDLTAASRPVALPHRLVLHLSYWWLLILLHRPFYRRSKSHSSGGDIDHVKLSNRAADNILLIATNWNNNFSIRYCPITIVQIIFSAGTVYVLSAIQAISGPRLGRVALSTSLDQIQQCIKYMDIIGESWDCANRVRDILLNILDQQLKPRLLMRNGEAGLKASVLSHIPSSTRSDESDDARSSASPPQGYATVPSSSGIQNSGHPISRQRLETDMYPSWSMPSYPHSLPPMNLPPPTSLTPTSSTSTSSGSGCPPNTLPSHRLQPQVQNPFIASNPIFSSGAGLDVDMDVNMNFTGMSMDFTMDPLTNAPVPYAAFSMPPNIMDYHPVSTNASGLPIRVGGASSSNGGSGGGLQRPSGGPSGHNSNTNPNAPAIPFSDADYAMIEHMVRQHQRSGIVQGPPPNQYRG